MTFTCFKAVESAVSSAGLSEHRHNQGRRRRCGTRRRNRGRRRREEEEGGEGGRRKREEKKGGEKGRRKREEKKGGRRKWREEEGGGGRRKWSNLEKMRNISLAFFVVPSFSLSLTAILVSTQSMHLSYLVERRERMRMMRG